MEVIMNGLAYFFRTPMDPDSGLVLFSPLHFLMIAVMLAGCDRFFCLDNRDGAVYLERVAAVF